MPIPRHALCGSLLPILAALSTFVAPAVAVRAEIRRCTSPQGGSVYTDKRCEDIGAIDRLPRATTGTAGSRLYRSGCARTLQDLVYELTSAVDSQDVNRLAGIYDWSGMATSNAYRVMDRLDAIAQRPLVDDDYYPQAAVRRAPVALRLEQTLGKSATPSRTVLGLRRYLGCWWLRL